MSIEAGKPYKFVNKRAGLALHLSTKEQTSVIGEDVQPVIRQSWIVEYQDKGGALIKSQATGLYIGFKGIPILGAKLIVGSREDAWAWDIIPENTPEYKIKLLHHAFVIEFPLTNLKPGTYAQLGLDFPTTTNKIWTLTKAS